MRTGLVNLPTGREDCFPVESTRGPRVRPDGPWFSILRQENEATTGHETQGSVVRTLPKSISMVQGDRRVADGNQFQAHTL